MRPRARLFMAFLALLSLLAMWAPEVAWTCPVTGSIATTLEVCMGSVAHKSTAPNMTCCHREPAEQSTDKTAQPAVSFCCEAVPLLPASPPIATVTKETRRQVAPILVLDGSPDFHLPATLAQTLSAASFLSSCYETSGVPFHFQNALSLHSGRAPPVWV